MLGFVSSGFAAFGINRLGFEFDVTVVVLVSFIVPDQRSLCLSVFGPSVILSATVVHVIGSDRHRTVIGIVDVNFRRAVCTGRTAEK